MTRVPIYCPRCNAEVGHFEIVVAVPVDVLDQQLENLEWSVRVWNCFREIGVKTVRDLVRLEPHELMRIPNFGRVSLREVEAELAQLKLHLGMDVSEKGRAG
jgi:DNA-directed RNA polymerase alpha subunit